MVGLRIIIRQLTGKVISEVEVRLTTKCNMKETSNTHLKEKIQALPMLYLRLVSIRAHNMCSIDIFCHKYFTT